MFDTLSRLTSALSDRYTIEHELGADGMAIVYLATDLKQGRQVAIKVMRPELAAAVGVDMRTRIVRGAIWRAGPFPNNPCSKYQSVAAIPF